MKLIRKLIDIFLPFGQQVSRDKVPAFAAQAAFFIIISSVPLVMLVLSLIPFKWSWWLTAFIIFRLFDALKPWPIKWFDRRIHGGLGIMLDDLIAAVMTLMVLGLFYWIA